MLTIEASQELIQAALSSLQRSGLLGADLPPFAEIVVLGNGSPLDSIAFVTLITEVEDRLAQATGQDLFLVLTDIHEFNPESSTLSAATLAQYLVKLAQG